MIKKFLGVVLVSALLGGTIGCSGKTSESKPGAGSSAAPAAAQNGKLEQVRFGLDSGAFSLQFRVAKAKGIFKKYGIDPVTSDYSFGIDTLNAAVLDQVDTAIGMDFAALTRLGKGNLRIVSLVSSPKPTNSNLYVRGNINKPEDLKGKHVGVQRGTVNEYVWARLLEKYGINKKDLSLDPLQSNAESIAAYEKGDLDAAWFGGAFIDRAEKVKDSKKLLDLSAIDLRNRGYFVVQERLAKEKPELVANILKALDEATKEIIANPEEAAELAYQELKLPKDGVLKELKNDWEFEVRFSQQDFDYLKGVLDWSVENGLIKDKFELKDKIILDPIKKALPDKVTYKP